MDRRPLQSTVFLVCISACGNATTRNGNIPEPVPIQAPVERTLSMLEADTWVRVVVQGDTVEGSVVSYQSGALTLRIADVERLMTPDTPSLALVHMDDLDALWERGVSKERARLAGGIAGGVLGALLGYWLVDTYQPWFGPKYEPSDGDYMTGIAIGGIVGVVLGGLTSEVVSSGRPVWRQLYP